MSGYEGNQAHYLRYYNVRLSVKRLLMKQETEPKYSSVKECFQDGHE